MGVNMRQEVDAATYLQVVRSAEEKTQAKAWDDAATLWAQAVAINHSTLTSSCSTPWWAE